MMPKKWVAHTVPFAPNVTGRFTERTFDEDGIPEEQDVEATCSNCGAVFKRKCTSGMVRQLIHTFATVHLHRHCLSAIPKAAKTA